MPENLKENISYAEDMLNRLSPFVDWHLLIPILYFIEKNQFMDQDKVDKMVLELFEKSKMVDMAIERYRKINNKEEEFTPEYLAESRRTVMSDLTDVMNRTDLTRQIIFNENDESLNNALEAQNYKQLFEHLESVGFKKEMLADLFEYAKFNFEIGSYHDADVYLSTFVQIAQAYNVPEFMKLIKSSMWGKVECKILADEFDANDAVADLRRLVTVLDSDGTSHLQSLQQRAWFIHVSLFILFRHDAGKTIMCEMFFGKNEQASAYINAVQALCPHILRYITAVCIITKKRDNFSRLVELIQQEKYQYSDPITQFMECVCVDFDFDKAQSILQECEKVMQEDFFLTGCVQTFIANARLLFFETFCRIHQRISLDKLAQKLNMSTDEVEKWLVDLIVNDETLDAKIDSKEGVVVMGTKVVSPYEQVISKTVPLSFCTQRMVKSIEKKVSKENEQIVTNEFDLMRY